MIQLILSTLLTLPGSTPSYAGSFEEDVLPNLECNYRSSISRCCPKSISLDMLKQHTSFGKSCDSEGKVLDVVTYKSCTLRTKDYGRVADQSVVVCREKTQQEKQKESATQTPPTQDTPPAQDTTPPVQDTPPAQEPDNCDANSSSPSVTQTVQDLMDHVKEEEKRKFKPLNFSHACMKRGSSDQNFSRDQRRVNGAETGMFYRAAFKGRNYGISSCVKLPETSLTDMYSAYGHSVIKKSADGSEFNAHTRVPYIYYGMMVGRKNIESGITYNPYLNGYTVFTRNMTGTWKNLSAVVFKPGDSVCMDLHYDKNSGKINFSLNLEKSKSQSLQSIDPLRLEILKKELSDDTFAGRDLQPRQVKRVVSVATRDRHGNNGGFNLSMNKEIQSLGTPFSATWTDSKLLDQNKRGREITPNDYYLTTSGHCAQTVSWPSMSIQTEINNKNEIRVTLYPKK